MTETEKTGTSLKKVASRVLRAALAGFITFLLVYFLSTLLYPPEALPPGYEPLFDVFVAIVVFFAVVIELSSGTILKYAFSAARALILIMYFVYALHGGIITTEMEMAHIMVDLRGFLAMLIFVNLLGLAKSILEAVDFLSEKEEQKTV